MFGYNESYDAQPSRFEAALTEWIDHTRTQRYSGNGFPRIVLLSPIAHEDLGDPNLPDGAENNARLAAYTDAIAAVAEEKGVFYVDLFGPSRSLYADADSPLTINGVHLNSDGNRQIARVVVQSLLGRSPEADIERVESVRAAVLDKNWHWFNRYRATDGNDVWGSRSTLAFTDGQTNYDVLQNELLQLDHMTSNRDAAIWAAAAGESIQPDDSNVPEAVEVVTNLAEPQVQDGVSKTGHVGVSQRRGGDREDGAPAGHGGQSLRVGGKVPRARQSRTARRGHTGSPVGGDMGDLPQVGADRGDGTTDCSSCPMRIETAWRMRRSPSPTCTKPDGIRVLERRRDRRFGSGFSLPQGHGRR